MLIRLIFSCIIWEENYEKRFDISFGIDENLIYIVNDKGDILGTVDEAWAKDANGNEVLTKYEIRGNELVQVVDFDEDTVFPVVADPDRHETKYNSFTLTPDEVYKHARAIRDKKLSNALTLVGATAAGHFKLLSKAKVITKAGKVILTKVGIVVAVIDFAVTTRDYLLDRKADEIEKYYIEIKNTNKKLKYTEKRVWNQGLNKSGYRYSGTSYTIVK